MINGDLVEDEFPEVVALAGVDENGAAAVFCSGTLIQKRWILTAAHCIEGAAQYEAYGLDLVVLWGDDLLGDGYDALIPWARGIENPEYDAANFFGDIGLVELAEPKLGVKAVVLSDADPSAWVGEELTYVGFGITSDFGQDTGTKRVAHIPVQAVVEELILAYDPEQNVCSGDSGGAVLRETPEGYELVANNTFVTPGCAGGSNGATRVDWWLDFVLGYVPMARLEPFEAAGHEDLSLGLDEEPGLSALPAPEAASAAGGCRTAPGGSWLFGFAALSARAAGRARRRDRRDPR